MIPLNERFVAPLGTSVELVSVAVVRLEAISESMTEAAGERRAATPPGHIE